MAGPFDVLAVELFKRQVKFKNGRYMLNIPLKEAERLNWIGSKHWALLQNKMVEQFGNDYYAYDYCAGKLWGYMFCGGVSSIVKTKRIVAEIMATISEQLGFGEIDTIKLKYDTDWATFEFHDSPIARESTKLFGTYKFPIDYSIAGLIAGSAEQLLKRKWVTVETTCVAMGHHCCTFQTIGVDAFREFLSKETNSARKSVYSKILSIEEKTDFGKEAQSLLDGQNKDAKMAEENYLREQSAK